MHVLSFGEGRIEEFLGSSQRSSTCVWQVRASIVVVTFELNINLVIICFTLRLRGGLGPRFLEWRFDKCLEVLDHVPHSKPQEGYFPIGVKSEN